MKPALAGNEMGASNFVPPPRLATGQQTEKPISINGKKAPTSSNRMSYVSKGGAGAGAQVIVADSRISLPMGKVIKSKLKTLAQIGEDWLYLALLGIIMALISFSMDTIIALFLNTRLRLYQDLNDYTLIIQYIGWCATPIVLVTFSSGFVHLCSPTVSFIFAPAALALAVDDIWLT